MVHKSPTSSPILRAGAAQIDIIPKADIHLAGAVGEFRPAQDVLDPLYARALVLESGNSYSDDLSHRNTTKKICFVSLDFTIITEDWTAKIREAVASECGLAKEAIMVHVTQTHEEGERRKAKVRKLLLLPTSHFRFCPILGTFHVRRKFSANTQGQGMATRRRPSLLRFCV